MLEVKNLYKKYGKKCVLNNMNYLFTPGIYGLLGPNGAGKSTLMNIISDVIDSSEGSVEYMGKNIKNMKSEYRKHIGYLPQNTGLYPEFTLTEMLEYFAYLRGLDKSKIPEMMEKVLTGTNLLSKKDDKIKTFSGEMKRRAAIAVTFIADPEILIFDEPTVGLDPKERIRFRELILNNKKDKVIIISSHIVSDLDMIADKILLIKEGVIAGEIDNDGSHNLEDEYMTLFEEDE